MTPPTSYPQLVRELDQAFGPIENIPPPTDEDAPPEHRASPITASLLSDMLDDDVGAALRKDVFERLLAARSNTEEWFRIGEVMRRKKIKREFNEAVKLHDRRNKQKTFGDWRQRFITRETKDGGIIIENVVSNIVLILENDQEWTGVLGFDEFSESIAIRGELPFVRRPGAWRDSDALETKCWIEAHYPIKPRTNDIHEAVTVICNRNNFNPLTSYLTALKHTGAKTIDTWLTDCFGAPNTPYTQTIGRMWLTSAVARAFNPGCKVDTVLVLEGGQGMKKSSVLSALCPNPSWFTDGLSDFGSKDQSAEIQGKWIVELGELKGMRKDLDRTKAFVTRQKEVYRPAYGRHVVEQLRKCVFAGTVNPSNDGYLLDETGNRRWWPVECSNKAPDITKEYRDNLWAQAVALWLSGETWWTEDSELENLIKAEQKKRLNVDPWQNTIEERLALKTDTSVDEVFDILKLDIGKWGHVEASRIGRVLKMLGWYRYRSSAGSRPWRYRRPSTEYEARSTQQ